MTVPDTLCNKAPECVGLSGHRPKMISLTSFEFGMGTFYLFWGSGHLVLDSRLSSLYSVIVAPENQLSV